MFPDADGIEGNRESRGEMELLPFLPDATENARYLN